MRSFGGASAGGGALSTLHRAIVYSTRPKALWTSTTNSGMATHHQASAIVPWIRQSRYAAVTTMAVMATPWMSRRRPGDSGGGSRPSRKIGARATRWFVVPWVGISMCRPYGQSGGTFHHRDGRPARAGSPERVYDIRMGQA